MCEALNLILCTTKNKTKTNKNHQQKSEESWLKETERVQAVSKQSSPHLYEVQTESSVDGVFKRVPKNSSILLQIEWGMESGERPTSCCEICCPTSLRRSQKQSRATEGEKSMGEKTWRQWSVINPVQKGEASRAVAKALPRAHTLGPHAYRGKFICEVWEHSLWGQQSRVLTQLIEMTQEDELVTLAPCPWVLQGFVDHPSCRVASF